MIIHPKCVKTANASSCPDHTTFFKLYIRAPLLLLQQCHSIFNEKGPFRLSLNCISADFTKIFLNSSVVPLFTAPMKRSLKQQILSVLFLWQLKFLILKIVFLNWSAFGAGCDPIYLSLTLCPTKPLSNHFAFSVIHVHTLVAPWLIFSIEDLRYQSMTRWKPFSNAESIHWECHWLNRQWFLFSDVGKMRNWSWRSGRILAIAVCKGCGKFYCLQQGLQLAVNRGKWNYE